MEMALECMNVSDRRLECSREDFLRTIELLWAARTRGSSIRITFEDGELTFRRAATAVRVPALGVWHGVANMPAQFVRDIRQ